MCHDSLRHCFVASLLRAAVGEEKDRNNVVMILVACSSELLPCEQGRIRGRAGELMSHVGPPECLCLASPFRCRLEFGVEEVSEALNVAGHTRIHPFPGRELARTDERGARGG